MAKAEEIRDGLLSISWTVHGFSSFRQSSSIVINDLPDKNFKTCSLTCKLEQNLLVLEMRTMDPPDSLLKGVVTASYNGVKHKMTLSESVWKAAWTWTPLPHCGNCSNSQHGRRVGVFSFELLIDLKPDCVISMKKGTKNILDHLEKLWENKAMSDVTFKCGEEVIQAHTSILVSGSPVLAAMFQNDFKESEEKVVLIEDIEVNVLENLLHYLYVGKCDFLENEEGNEEGVADLLVAANKYDIELLRKECETYLSNFLTVENALKFLVLAHLHNSPELNEAALNFIAKNAKPICSQNNWMDVIKTYPELCFQATQLIAGTCACASRNLS